MKKYKLISILAILTWVLVGIYGVIFNISYIDEAKYLIKGWLILTKQIQYYRTENFIYQHMPGSLLWYGLGQRIFGPSLLVGRIQSFLVGLSVLWCSFLLGKRLAGKKGGVITLVLLSLSPVIAFYYSAAVPQSLVVLMLLLGFIFLYDGLVKKSESRFLLASVFFSLTFVIRENFLFTLILYLGFLFWVFKSKLKQFFRHIVVVMIIAGIFIVPGYPGTVEVLKNFPGISYLLPVSMAEKEVLSLYWKKELQTYGLHFRAIREFGVIFHAWILILFFIVLDWLKKKQWRLKIKMTPKQLFWMFLIIIAGFNFVIHSWAAFRLSPRAIVSYFSYIAPLVAVIMATLITPKMKTKQYQQIALVTYLSLLLLVPTGLRFARIFAIPTRNPDLRAVSESADKLKPIIKNKDKILWLSEPISLYLAGKVSYYPLIHHTGFYKPSSNTKIVKHLGFWNQEMLEKWLKEVDLVVIGGNKIKLLKEAPKVKHLADFIETRLNLNFELVEERNDIWPGELRFYLPKKLTD